jgi:Chaperone of endosialidase
MNGPQAPNPYQTAAAQTGSNQSTAITNQLLNMTNQTNPYGSVNYKQTGTNSYFDPTQNKTVELPQFTQTTTLDPAQQKLLDQNNQFATQANGLALNQLGAVSNTLSQPFSYTPGDYEKWAGSTYDALNGDTNNRANSALQTQLANQGVTQGSAAYDNAMKDLTYGQDKARNDFMLNAYGTGMNTALTTRNQPLNEAAALRSGNGVTQPQFNQTPQTSVAGTNVAGLINNNYQNQVSQYNSTLGGIAGLGSAIAGGWMASDKRLKTDIHKIGESPIEGIGIHAFKYKGSPIQHIGALAQEVEKKVPSAVAKMPNGYKAVNYNKLTHAMMGAA